MMNKSRRPLIIGIPQEARDSERRAPLTPSNVKWLIDQGLKVEVVSCPKRIFEDKEYRDAGATVVKKTKKANFMVGIKAPEPENLLPGKVYMIFSHTMKGQRDNISLLKEMLKKGVTLIDYEKIRDNRGKRIVFFGRFAGICGLVDSLHYYGKKMALKGIKTPFLQIKPSWKYRDLEHLKEGVSKVGEIIATKGLSKRITPFIIGMIGRGNVSSGAQEVLALMNSIEVHPQDMRKFIRSKNDDGKHIYSIVFYREEKLRHKAKKKFYFEEYLDHPGVFESNMDKYISELNMLVNTSYWDDHYPRLITKKMIQTCSKRKNFRLQFISDISCDVEGAVELTYKTTTQKKPVYTYDPVTNSFKDGVNSRGISILAIDNLPTELPADSSENFSDIIREYVYQVAAHGSKDIVDHIALPREIREATITQRNSLTDSYQYLKWHLQ
ncbi:MAG: hypothetical protein P9L88_01325 [Candidatus Tantalella remota]|nr:hypothetical protein [Candidatus Tantalella remota]